MKGKWGIRKEGDDKGRNRGLQTGLQFLGSEEAEVAAVV